MCYHAQVFCPSHDYGEEKLSAPTVCMHELPRMLDVVPPQIPKVRYARNLVNVVRN